MGDNIYGVSVVAVRLILTFDDDRTCCEGGHLNFVISKAVLGDNFQVDGFILAIDNVTDLNEKIVTGMVMKRYGIHEVFRLKVKAEGLQTLKGID